ncbi:hypothetical protein MHU86_14639 [Fragilaria crotonensis]|nr:hypothetical protein MHU86_14639 [Fragilaria crotonensis]
MLNSVSLLFLLLLPLLQSQHSSVAAELAIVSRGKEDLTKDELNGKKNPSYLRSSIAAGTSSTGSTTTTGSSNRAGRLLDWAGPLDNRYKSTKISEAEKQRLHLYPPDYVFVDANGVDNITVTTSESESTSSSTSSGDTEGTLAIVDTVAEEQQVDQVLDEVKDQGEGESSRRKFVSYEPSKWEEGWVDAIPNLVEAKAICQTLLGGKHQQDWLHKFLNMMCSARPEPPNDSWCYFHDHNHFVWYNSKNLKTFELYIDKTPLQLDGIEPPVPMPINTLEMEKDWEEIASKFTFLDETTGEEYYEYIEPLVGHLRFPLAGCLERKPLLAEFASFVIPPPSLSRVDGRTIMYDMGSSDWSRMEYIVEEWNAHDAGFTYLITYAPSENENVDGFLESVPDKHQSHIYRHYFNLVDHPPTEHSDPKDFFLPDKIRDQSRPDDYIMVKFDRTMNADLKLSLVQYILDYPMSSVHVDEVFWEINASGNYIMQPWFDTNLKFDEVSSMSLSEAYGILTSLRNRGIRAHAWI